MVAKGHPLPRKLKDDSIVEALFEARFNMATLPEVFIGRIIETPAWKGFQQRRLPASEIPVSMREADPNLRFMPVFELTDGGERPRAVRIGPHALSYHRQLKYVGWEHFQPELNQAVEALFQKADGLEVQRLGLRYLNALTTGRHGINGLGDLDFSAHVAGERLSGSVTFNYLVNQSPDTKCSVRIATTDLVQGPLPEGTSVYIDVDVFTRDGFRTADEKAVRTWVEAAHAIEKAEFFRLLTKETIEALKEP